MLERIQKVFEETMNVDASEVVPTANLAEDLDIDSLAAVELALELENEFGIENSNGEKGLSANRGSTRRNSSRR